MIAKLEWALRTAQQNKDQTQNHNKQWEQQWKINQHHTILTYLLEEKYDVLLLGGTGSFG